LVPVRDSHAQESRLALCSVLGSRSSGRSTSTSWFAPSACRGPARPSAAPASLACRAARVRTRRSPPCGSEPKSRSSAAWDATSSPRRHLPGCGERPSGGGGSGRREAQVEERCLVKDAPTGIALITVDAAGETTIVVAPGANAELRPGDLTLEDADAVLCQQEIPAETVARAADLAPRFFLNAAPAREGAPEAELTIVNRLELEALGE